ncbi:MAG: 50S ribosomal protein L25 [Treponema sp.]|jgi:large subunit ribosomal protein L25|nr:50S ribosomal protein L25 [Treponema sp.]
MSKVVLSARKRERSGSISARNLRKAGRVPAVIYGRSVESLPIDLDAKEFAGSVKNITESTIVMVDVDGQFYDAFVKDTQRDVRDGNILHVDFYVVEKDVTMRAKVHLLVQGTPIGVRDGGTLELPLHEIEVECLPKDLPERIAVDISGLKANQSIHVRDIALGENVKLVSSGDQVVALVKFAKADTSAEEEAVSASDQPAAAAATDKK